MAVVVCAFANHSRPYDTTSTPAKATFEMLHAKLRRVPDDFRTMAYTADVGRIFQGRRLDGLNWVRWRDNTGALYFTDFREVFLKAVAATSQAFSTTEAFA